MTVKEIEEILKNYPYFKDKTFEEQTELILMVHYVLSKLEI